MSDKLQAKRRQHGEKPTTGGGGLLLRCFHLAKWRSHKHTHETRKHLCAEPLFKAIFWLTLSLCDVLERFPPLQQKPK